MRILAAALLGSAVLGASPAVAPQTPGAITPSFVGHLIDRYAAADYAAVDTGLRSIVDIKSFSGPFARATSDLNQATNLGQVERARRRLVAATFALEVVNRRGAAQPHEAAALIEAACKLVRATVTPTPAERPWYWASIALLEALADGEALDVHAGHARQRVPDEPRFVLARAVAAELLTFPADRGESPMDTDSTRALLTIARLQEAQKDDGTREEARMRLGYFYLRLRRREPALEQLRGISPTSPDRYVRYLARLFEGRALQELDRLPDAIAAYRSAVQTVPGAQTAEMMLAAALARQGDRAEAADVMQQSVTTTDGSTDPWTMYGQADVRFWPQIIASLRAALK